LREEIKTNESKFETEVKNHEDSLKKLEEAEKKNSIY
jgi:hypothetical protein